MDDMTDLSFRFRVALQQWQADLSQAQQMYNNFRMSVERPINLGGVGGGGVGSGMPAVMGGMSTPTSAPVMMPSNGGAATISWTNTQGQVQQQHMAIQSAPRAAAATRVQGEMQGPPLPPNYASFNGGPSFAGAVAPAMNIQGTGAYGRIASFGKAYDASMGASRVSRPLLNYLSGVVPSGGNVNFPGIAFGSQPMTRYNGIAGDMSAGVSGTSVSGSELSETPETRAAKKKAGFPLRALIFGTIYGLIADALAGAAGAQSQYSAGMMLVGNDQGAQALLKSKQIRSTARFLPYVGPALEALVGAAGLDESDARVALAGNIDASSQASADVGFERRGYRNRADIARAGPNTFSVRRLEIEGRRQQLSGEIMQKNKIALDAWDKANPMPVKEFEGGTYSGFNTGYAGAGSSGRYEQEMAQRQQQRSLYTNYVNSRNQAARSGLDADSDKATRDFKYAKDSMTNDVNRARMENRFAPRAALGQYEVSQFQAEAAYHTQGASPEDMALLGLEGKMGVERLRGGQRDALENVLYGRVKTYNPYTESPLAYTERTTETTQSGYDALTRAIEQLTAEIQKLPKGAGP